MSKKKFLTSFLCVVFFILTLSITGCTPTGNPQETQESKADKTTEKKLETSGLTAPKSVFSDISIVFFPGGTQGGEFETTVYNGAKQAASDLGCKVEYIWSDWNSDKMIAGLKNAITKKPDGIAVMGHPGDSAYKAIVDEAESKGIVITSQNAPLPILQESYKTKGFGYVGQDTYASGKNLAKGLLTRSNLKASDKVFIWGLRGTSGERGKRTQGIVDTMIDNKMKVDYLEISQEINSDARRGEPVLKDYVSKHPDVKAIITDHGELTSLISQFLASAGKKPGDIFVGGFDLNIGTASAIKDGWICATLDQQPFLQGYLPVLQLCLSKKYGFAGLSIDTGSSIVDKSNVDFIFPLIEKRIR